MKLSFHRSSNKLALILFGLATHSFHNIVFAYDPVCSNYHDGVCLAPEVDDTSFQCLYQGDFDQGTKVINEPGHYKLCEDITFYPLVHPPTTSREGAADAFEPIFTETYDENSFGLGFFSALSIASSDVTLHLNGFTIEQSVEHALLQRFFAVVELANSPFIQGAGPAQFVGDSPNSTPFVAASNVKILGPGTIGRSSHHGIHGNENRNVEIKNVEFIDFEVAAVSLNNVDELIIEDCEIKRNRQDVPILGIFSSAKFIRPYGKILKDSGFKMNLRGVETSAAFVYDNLVKSINNVYRDVIQTGFIREDKHPQEYELFHNSRTVIDGPCYAFLVHGKGPAVNDFGFEQLGANQTSSKVLIRNNKVKNMKCWTYEVPAIVEEGKVVNDPRGSVLQLIRPNSDKEPIAINKDGTYKGNVVADMQIMVAKAIIDGNIQDTPQLQTPVNSINENIINWASSKTLVYEPKYRCNGDSMHHVVKGITVIRVDDVVGFEVEKNMISDIENLSPPPFEHCNDFHLAQNEENRKTNSRQGGNILGISVASSTGFDNVNNGYDGSKTGYISSLAENYVSNFESENGSVIVGIDIQGKSDYIKVVNNKVDLIMDSKDSGKTKKSKGKSKSKDKSKDKSKSRDSAMEDKYASLRTRSFNDKDVHVGENEFVQPTQVVEFDENDLLTNSNGCPVQKMKWKYGTVPGGSCPFSKQ